MQPVFRENSKNAFATWRDRGSTLAILGFIVFILLQIPHHVSSSLKSIRIHGNTLIDKTTIAKNLGIYEGQSWFSIDPYEISTRLTKLPWIEKAIVKRNLGLGLDIYISERKPVAYLKVRDQLAMICQDYWVLERIDRKMVWNLPVIVYNSIDTLIFGQHLKAYDLDGAFWLMELLQTTTVLPLDAVSEIIADDPLNIELITIPDGIKVKLGFENFREKLRNLALASFKINEMRHKISTIDLRNKSGVVITHKYQNQNS